ncbi:hypothetical protein ACFLVY_01430 [Chloroflexota bacterium]
MNSSRKSPEEALNHCLKHFELDEEALKKGDWGKENPVKLPPDNLPLPPLVFLCFVALKGFGYWGKAEKVFWKIPIKYKSLPFLLSHRKFGFRVHRKGEVDYPENIVDAMIKDLNKAIRVADRMIQPFAEQQVRSGNVTVANHYIKLDMMYRFFRDKARRCFSRPAPKPEITGRDKDGTPIAWSHDPYKYEREGFYNSIGMVDAFFSRLEHVLILVLPFIGFDPATEDLAQIMSANWADKYKRVFDLAANAKAKTLLEKLIFIKEKYRNAIIHGYFEKKGASLFFHIPPYAVPVLLSRFRNSVQYSFLPITTMSYEEICSIFDEVDSLLKEGTTKYGVRFAESGLDLPFDAKSISRYHAAQESDEAFESFVEFVGYWSDLSVNMDW